MREKAKHITERELSMREKAKRELRQRAKHEREG